MTRSNAEASSSTECYRKLGPVETAHLVDGIKRIGFTYATRAGITIAIDDISVPPHKQELLDKADADVTDIDRQFQRGLITDDERYEQVVADLAAHHPGRDQRDDGGARSAAAPSTMMATLGRPRKQGQHRPARPACAA